jgi:hypothetical protein
MGNEKHLRHFFCGVGIDYHGVLKRHKKIRRKAFLFVTISKKSLRKGHNMLYIIPIK